MKRIFYSVAVIATVAVAAYGVFLSQQKNSVAAFSDLILSEVETLAGNEAGDKDDDDERWWMKCIAQSAAMMKPSGRKIKRGR